MLVDVNIMVRVEDGVAHIELWDEDGVIYGSPISTNSNIWFQARPVKIKVVQIAED